MAQNTEPKIELQEAELELAELELVIEEELRAREELEEQLRSTSQSTEVREETPEALEQNLKLDRKKISPESHFENKLSSRLDQYREKLNKKQSLTPQERHDLNVSLKEMRALVNEQGKFKRLRPTKSQLSKDISKPTSPSIMADPLGFLASLIKKIENFLLGNTDLEEQVEPAPKTKIKVKRKKKGSSLSSKKEKSGLYHLDEAAEQEELVDLEIALAEGSLEPSTQNSTAQSKEKTTK